MVKPKSQSKKPKKGGVDFKKIKRRIGRKLPPPKNATNTEIKSKAIVLREQSIASEKSGLTKSKKGLTLKELLQQTSHHNAKVRKDALLGIKEILLKKPAELKSHKLAVIEKLRERIRDDDKLVREMLLQLFKSVIFPGCGEDNQGPLVSLMMVYIFSAMTHLAIDVRLMAFKFCDLVLQFYPTSFSLYAEKILQNYGDILRQNLLSEDKDKLKSILSGLVRCLSLLSCYDREDSYGNDVSVLNGLDAYDPKVIGLADVTTKVKDLLPILVYCFQEFTRLVYRNSQLDAQSYDCMQFMLQSVDLVVRFFVFRTSRSAPHAQIFPCLEPDDFISTMLLKNLWDIFPLSLLHHSDKDEDLIFTLNTVITKIFLQLRDWSYPPALLEKFLEFIESSLSTKGKVFREENLLPLIPYIPKLASQMSGDWRHRVLQAFTKLFKNCYPESSMKLACLSAVEEMLDPEMIWLDADDPAIIGHQINWVQELRSLLILLDDKNPLPSKAVLRILFRVGQTAPRNVLFVQEFDHLEYNFRAYFGRKIEEYICYGPFIRLTADVQEFAINCIYYFSSVGKELLQSLALCCLCDDLDQQSLFKILNTLDCAFRGGRIRTADYMSFHLTLLSRFRVYPEKNCSGVEIDGKSNWDKFKSVTRTVSSYLKSVGREDAVFQILEKFIVDQICSKIPTDNGCAYLRLLVKLDTRPTSLSDDNILKISRVLPQYLFDIVSTFGEEDNEATSKTRRYYLLPSLFLFDRSERLLHLSINVMASWVFEVFSSPGSDLPPPSAHPTIDRSTTVCVITSIILHLYKDVKMRPVLLMCKNEIGKVLHNLLRLLSCEGINLSLEERHKVEDSYDRLRPIIDA